MISAKRWDARTAKTVILEIRASDAVTICRRMGVSQTAGAERTVNRMDNALIWVAAVFLMLPFTALALMSVLVIIRVVKMIVEEITGW